MMGPEEHLLIIDEDDDYQRVYNQSLVQRLKQLPIGTFIYYLIMNCVGFTFLNVVNIERERESPLMDADHEYKTFVKTVFIVTPIIFFASGIVSMRGTKYSTVLWTTGLFLGL